MNNESKSNKLNEIFSSLKFNENQNYKKNKTSYNNSPKYNIIHLTKTCTKSASLNDIYTQKDLIEKKLIGHLYLKELENSKNKNHKYFFIGSNSELNKLSFEKYTNYLWKNSYNGSNEIQEKNKNIFYKRTSMLPYLYRNLHKKKIAKKLKNIFSKSNKEFFHSNLHKLKMNSSYDNKSPEHFNDDISFHQFNIFKKSNINKNLADKNDVNIHKINRQKNNSENKENTGNSFIINKTGKNEYQITLKKNNSQLFLKNLNNNDKYSYRKFGFLNKNLFMKNNYFKENKRPDIKKISLDLINHNKISKEHIFNNNNALLDYGKDDMNSIKINHINNKPLIKDEKNYKKINNIKDKNDVVINNSSKPIIMKSQNNKEGILTLINKNKGFGKESMEENYLFDEDKDDEIDKIFNTNQINFFKFRKDIKEEPDLEEEID
jgi:hypothetical protein